MTLQPSPEAQAPGAASQSTMEAPKLGAFDSPVKSAIAAGAKPEQVKPVTESVQLDPVSGRTSDASQVEIPKNLPWSQQTTMVQAAKPTTGGTKALVTLVKDGDTVNLKAGDSAITCRIDTIDAPETAKPAFKDKPAQAEQPFGNAAADKLRSMIENKEVTVKVATAKDKYGRNICQIELDGANIDKEMVRSGMAWVYRKFGVAVNPELELLEQAAKAGKVGLWSDPNPVNPRDHREMSKYGRRAQ